MPVIARYDSKASLDVCIPCYEVNDRLLDTIISLTQTADLQYNLIISIEKQSVVKNRLACLAKVKTRYVLWLDDDVIFLNANWMSRLYLKLHDDFRNAVVGVRLLKKDLMYSSQMRPNGEVSDVCGAVMMTRIIDGLTFDENYIGGYYEDTDYCFSARSAGFKVIQDNSIEVLHINDDLYKGNEYNKNYFEIKWRK